MTEDLGKRLKNLVGTRSLKEGIREQSEIDQYLANAADLQGDAESAKTILGRFTLAYEGIHCVAMAVLNHLGVRPGDGEGHRTVALQVAVDALRMSEDDPNANRVLSHLHDTRNRKIYRQPLPPVTKNLADNAAVFLRRMLPLARAETCIDPDQEANQDPGSKGP